MNLAPTWQDLLSGKKEGMTYNFTDQKRKKIKLGRYFVVGMLIKETKVYIKSQEAFCKDIEHYLKTCQNILKKHNSYWWVQAQYFKNHKFLWPNVGLNHHYMWCGAID